MKPTLVVGFAFFDMILHPEELKQYSRHIILPQFGIEKQVLLKQSKVLVIGAGGLGSPILLYLAAAGVGNLGIVDFDIVDTSNLHRQIIYNYSHQGKLKSESAKDELELKNPHIVIDTHTVYLNRDNIMSIIEKYDLIIDGSDNFSTRYLVNDACVLANKPLVYGAIYQFTGQVSVFNCPNEQGVSVNYRDLYPSPPAPGEVPSCHEAGVLGILPGQIGCMMATEAIKILTGIGKTLAGKLLMIDVLAPSYQTISILPDPENPISGNKPTLKSLIDYDEFCNFNATNKQTDKMIKEITPLELKQMMDENSDFQLIDVREEYEYDICNLGGVLIPLGNVLNETEKIAKDKPVVVHCRSGKRSATAILELQARHGFDNLINLKGGILAWSDEVDSTVPKY